MGLKFNRGKKITIALSGAFVFVILGVVFLGNGALKDNLGSRSEDNTIENDIPFISSDSEGIEGIDNEEILNRYEKINKNSLTYETANDPTMEDLSDPYFYETEQGFTLNIKENGQIKPINDEKYAKVLLGYSFVGLEQPITRNDAIYKANLILPENYEEVRAKSYDDYELVHYSSDKGNFVVYLGYERIFNEDNIFTGIDKDKIESISYFKTI